MRIAYIGMCTLEHIWISKVMLRNVRQLYRQEASEQMRCVLAEFE